MSFLREKGLFFAKTHVKIYFICTFLYVVCAENAKIRKKMVKNSFDGGFSLLIFVFATFLGKFLTYKLMILRE